MKADRLMDALGKVKEDYIMESAPGKKKNKRFHFRWIAAVIALVMILTFFQTAPGVAALELVKEAITSFIETLFPPKDIPVNVEGETEVKHHEAQGRDPDEESPGFAMYVDTESYVMTEENGAYYVRQIPVEYDREEIRRQQAALLEGLSPEEQEAAIDARIQELKDLYASLPTNEIEIQEVPNKEFSTYAEEVRNQMSVNWEIIEDITWIEKPLAYTFSVSGGNTWDSPYEVHYFVDNGDQGTFHIVARYNLEAAEGHGTRFASMIQTFEIVTDEDTSQYNGVITTDPTSTSIAKTQNSGETILHKVLQNQSVFHLLSNEESMTLEEYCASESERMGFTVSIFQYTFVDMDNDGIQEAVVDFCFGENNQVMCMVLDWDNSNEIVSGTEFYYRQLSQIKEDGSFAYSGGGDNDGWARLRWDNDDWAIETVEDSSQKSDVQWYSYPMATE